MGGIPGCEGHFFRQSGQLRAEGLRGNAAGTTWNGPVHADFAEVAELVDRLRAVGAEAGEVSVRNAGLEALVLHQTGEALAL